MTALHAENLSAGYAGAAVIHDLTAAFRGGGFTVLAGPNGAGKSTLLKALAGLVPPLSGVARLNGETVAEMDPRARARAIAWLPPDGRTAWPLSAWRVAALGRAPHLKPLRRFSAADHAAVDDALARAGASALAQRRFDELSSGERARVLIARALATGADVLLLDEPTAALDPRHQIAVMEMLRAEADRGAVIVAAVHALELAAGHADRVVLMDAGRVAADGPPGKALDEANMRAVFGVSAPGGVKPAGWRAF
ncbi:MAG: ABC transporter ATP-binding protein [Maricaulaceae bacterium]|nr:ABC transporter ATP-binding protein [Maricaulaceae bacterium]